MIFKHLNIELEKCVNGFAPWLPGCLKFKHALERFRDTLEPDSLAVRQPGRLEVLMIMMMLMPTMTPTLLMMLILMMRMMLMV